VDNTGGPNGPVTVQFFADATADREHDDIEFFWQFGDNATSTLANPVHTFAENVVYNVSLTTTDIHGASDIAWLQVFADDPRPVVTITSPIPNLPEKVFVYSVNETIVMNAVAIANGPVTWQWEYQLVHWSHYHPEIRIVNAQTFTDSSPPDESDVERNNVLLWARATDSFGLVGQDYIRISRPDWLTVFGNHAPVADFVYVSDNPPRVGQPIYFDARKTIDVDVDRLTYTWFWGDGIIGDGVVTTHTYDNFAPAGYTVYLNVTDNWGASGGYTLNIPVYARQSLRPSADYPPGYIYEDFNVTLSSIQAGAIIYYELVSGNGVGIQVTPCSRLYTGPISIRWIPGYNVTLLTAAILPGALESTMNVYTYIMTYAPCDVLGFGIPGNLATRGNLFCSNTNVQAPPTSYSIIPQIYPYGSLYTSAPPPYANLVTTFQITNLIGVVDPSRSYVTNTTMLSIWVDQNTSLGAVGLCEVSYDFTGDGTWDRNETFGVLSPDPLVGYENFNFLDPSMRFPPPAGIVGEAYQPLVRGTVLVQLWTSIGPINNGTCPIFVQSGLGYKNGNGILVFSNIQIPYLAYTYQQLPPVSVLPPSTPYFPGVCNSTWITGIAPTTGFSTTGFSSPQTAPQTGSQTGHSSASSSSEATLKATTRTEVSVSHATLLHINLAAVVFIGLLFFCKL
jgi:PKD repeat protein